MLQDNPSRELELKVFLLRVGVDGTKQPTAKDGAVFAGFVRHCVRAKYFFYLLIKKKLKTVKPGRILRACKQCHTTQYCNKKCQRQHWSEGGHKRECTKKNNL